jgi:GNAT superfamily N-acetyltransferase
MLPLPFNEHEAARPLFQAFEDQLAVNAILDGTAPATIYVDNAHHPQAAFTWWRYHCFLGGSECDEEFNKAIRRLLLDTLFPHALEAGLDLFELRVAPESWGGPVEGILRGHNPVQAWHHYYRFKALRHDVRARLPEGFHLRWIDATLVEATHLKNLAILRDELCSERASVEDFLAHGFGVCALYGDEIAGWCTSEYNSGDRCEVGIGTLQPYQCRGLATAMATALIKHAQSRDITHMGWHCDARNAASIATALKVGFERMHEYPTYLIWIDRKHQG